MTRGELYQVMFICFITGWALGICFFRVMLIMGWAK